MMKPELVPAPDSWHDIFIGWNAAEQSPNVYICPLDAHDQGRHAAIISNRSNTDFYGIGRGLFLYLTYPPPTTSGEIIEDVGERYEFIAQSLYELTFTPSLMPHPPKIFLEAGNLDEFNLAFTEFVPRKGSLQLDITPFLRLGKPQSFHDGSAEILFEIKSFTIPQLAQNDRLLHESDIVIDGYQGI